MYKNYAIIITDIIILIAPKENKIIVRRSDW